MVWIEDFQMALMAQQGTLVSSLVAFDMSGLECLTKYNNILTPEQYLVCSLGESTSSTFQGA
jgi:hypothetical protein